MNKLSPKYTVQEGRVLETVTLDLSDWAPLMTWFRSLLAEVELPHREYELLFELANMEVKEHQTRIMLDHKDVHRAVYFLNKRIMHCTRIRPKCTQVWSENNGYEVFGERFVGKGYRLPNGYYSHNESTMLAMTRVRDLFIEALIGPISVD